MKLLLIICCFQLFTFSLFAQTEVNKINIAAGPSLHGTGDLKGFMVSVLYEHEYSKRFSFSNGLTTTIHYGKDKAFNSLFPGVSPENRLMNFTTAGIQLNSSGNYHLVSKHDWQLSAFAGAMLRFQSTSLPSIYSYTQDQTVYPEPFNVIYNNEKPNTLCPGYSFGLSFKNRISHKCFLGVKAGFQNDTNGDAITFVSLMFEKVLPRLKSE